MVEHRLVFDQYEHPTEPNGWYIERNVLTPAECDKLVLVAESYPTYQDTMGYNNPNSDSAGDHRDTWIYWLPQDMGIPALNRMWTVFHDRMKHHNDNIWKFDLDVMNEKAQYAKYEVGGHFGWHMDLGKEQMSVRKLTAVIMLSDVSEYEGGMLQMFNNIAVPLGKGDAIFFPSFMLHRVTQVTKGTRRSAVLWAGGKFYS